LTNLLVTLTAIAIMLHEEVWHYLNMNHICITQLAVTTKLVSSVLSCTIEVGWCLTAL